METYCTSRPDLIGPTCESSIDFKTGVRNVGAAAKLCFCGQNGAIRNNVDAVSWGRVGRDLVTGHPTPPPLP